MSVARVLVVDDDTTVASVVAGYLERHGHAVDVVADGAAALSRLGVGRPDLVVLDLMLPGIDGLELCRRARLRYPDLPIVMLTARGESGDRIAGLEAGADDYVSKPFSPRELALRVDSVLRRVRAGPGTPGGATYRFGDVVVDTAARRATRGAHIVELTVREFDLLAFLAASPGRAFRRSELMREVWGWTFGDESTVTVHIRRLRQKLERDPGRPELIQTVWGVGYRLEPV